MFNVIEHDLTEAIGAGKGHVFQATQLGHLIQSESKVQQILKSVLSRTMIMIPLTKIVKKLMEKSFNGQRLKNMEEP